MLFYHQNTKPGIVTFGPTVILHPLERILFRDQHSHFTIFISVFPSLDKGWTGWWSCDESMVTPTANYKMC